MSIMYINRVRVRVVLKVAAVVVVVVTKFLRFRSLVGALFLLSLPTLAAVLPEDRADALYHRYDGGGVTIDGPSYLVRKGDNKNFSAFANYYVDSVSSASIDVVTQGSPYNEQRTEYSVGMDYLHNKAIMNLSFTNSDESDYTGNTVSTGISIDMFGDLTTVALGYARGWDDVKQNGQPDFKEDVDRRNYRLSLTQILTTNMVMNLAWETVTEKGFLNNPYRSSRYLDPSSASGFSFQPERYPDTRTSNAASGRMRYFLPYRAALYGEYRYFDDDWDISAHTARMGYTHPMGDWIFDTWYRYYKQDGADFYSDCYPFANSQNFLARDKELSDFNSNTLGVELSYLFVREGWGFIDEGSLNVSWSRIWFDYDNFRNIKSGGTACQEETYDFNADVWKVFLSIWF